MSIAHWTARNMMNKMRAIKKALDRFPYLKSLLKTVYWRLQGLPPVSDAAISKDMIQDYIGRDDPVILEIGCNDGSHTLLFLEIFKNPIIYCFEPDPRAVARFKANIGQRSNVKLFEIALSDHDGEIEFNQSGGRFNEEQAQAMPQGWDCSGSIRRPKKHLTLHPWITFDSKITVKTSTLDTWHNNNDLGGAKLIDFIWMDVQGAEIDVFRGGKNTLAKTRFLYTEYCNQELFEGQINLRKMIKYLKIFNVIIRYPDDVLLNNKKLAGKQSPER